MNSRVAHIADEIALAAKTGELTNKLRQLLTALSSIPAASVENERVFSVAGGFMTKIRSRLSDTTMDHFSFAKCKFKNEKLKKVVNIPIFQYFGSVPGNVLVWIRGSVTPKGIHIYQWPVAC